MQRAPSPAGSAPVRAALSLPDHLREVCPKHVVPVELLFHRSSGSGSEDAAHFVRCLDRGTLLLIRGDSGVSQAKLSASLLPNLPDPRMHDGQLSLDLPGGNKFPRARFGSDDVRNVTVTSYVADNDTVDLIYGPEGIFLQLCSRQQPAAQHLPVPFFAIFSVIEASAAAVPAVPPLGAQAAVASADPVRTEFSDTLRELRGAYARQPPTRLSAALGGETLGFLIADACRGSCSVGCAPRVVNVAVAGSAKAQRELLCAMDALVQNRSQAEQELCAARPCDAVPVVVLSETLRTGDWPMLESMFQQLRFGPDSGGKRDALVLCFDVQDLLTGKLPSVSVGASTIIVVTGMLSVVSSPEDLLLLTQHGLPNSVTKCIDAIAAGASTVTPRQPFAFGVGRAWDPRSVSCGTTAVAKAIMVAAAVASVSKQS